MGPGALLALLVVLAASLAPAAAVNSKLWGKSGELWSPKGRLMDWSFAGYHQGNEPPPRPPVTRKLEGWLRGGRSDTQAIVAALKWAHSQPASQWVVIELPPRRVTLTAQLIIRKPRIVLRGAPGGKTVLWVPKALNKVIGPSSRGNYGYFVNEAFISFRGSIDFGRPLAAATGNAQRGDTKLVVDRPDKLRVGNYYTLTLSDKGGSLAKALHNNNPQNPPGPRIFNRLLVRFRSKVLAVNGKVVTFERPFPFDVRASYVPRIHAATGTIYESGVEDLTFHFNWDEYKGHHYEDGYNAVEFVEAYDCWARNIKAINADNGVFVHKSIGVQINGLTLTQEKPRFSRRYSKDDDSGDAHWGVHSGSSADLLVDGFDIGPRFIHGAGADAMSMYAVFTRGRLQDSNLELHRAVAGQALFTQIVVGDRDRTIGCGGPKGSGPCSQVYTTFWNVRGIARSSIPPPVHTAETGGVPGSCKWGPDVTFVGTKVEGKVCKDWMQEPAVTQPANLYDAQLARRRRARAASTAVPQA